MTFTSTSDGPTLSDFASRPRFLRWFTEWGENFCKEQKKKYNDLVQKCTGCNEQTCEGECETCKSQCGQYEKFITQWKSQWEKQRDKYQKLYNKTTKSDNTVPTEQEELVLEYLSELKSTITTGDPDTTYDTAGKYMEKAGFISECMEQNNFSKNDDKKYAFKDYPHNYAKHCICNPASPPVDPSSGEEKAPKEVVPEKKSPKHPQKPRPKDYRLTDVLLPSAFPLSVGIAFLALSYFVLKVMGKKNIYTLVFVFIYICVYMLCEDICILYIYVFILK